MKAVSLLAFLTVALTGCREPDAAITSRVEAAETVHFNPEAVHVMQPVPGQRFTPTSSVLVSYDTETGQICRTYGWGNVNALMETCASLLQDESWAKARANHR